jgi:predicted secreted protein/Zn-dependent peptidase ImmA (M78 family)
MALSRLDIKRQGVAEAEEHLIRIGVDCTKPIDVYKIICEMDIVLMFRPLEGKPDGFYLPQSPSRPKPGILINSRRPHTRQRYTAAHELCHFLKKHPASIDVVTEGSLRVPRSGSKEDVLAESFAEHFLMPARLVTHFFRKLGLKRGELDEKDIYRLALCMRASYAATCNHLFNLGFISQNQHTTLTKIPPKKIKSTWSEGLGHNDIWPIDKRMNDFYILPVVEDIIQIRLPETPSTGYVWQVENERRGVLSHEDSMLLFSGEKTLVGQTGERLLTFRVIGHGKEHLRICLNRPWEKKGSTADEFNLRINAAEKEFIGFYAKDQLLLAA